VLSILRKIETLGVCGTAVISVADVGTRLQKQYPIEVTTVGLVIEHTPSTAKPLQEFFSDRFFGAIRMLDQKLHIRPCRNLLFTDVENEIWFGRHLPALEEVGWCLGATME